MLVAGDSYTNSGSYSSSWSLLSSSDEEIKVKKDKKKDAGGPARLCFIMHKRVSYKPIKKRRSRKQFYFMVLEDENDDSGASNSGSDSEVQDSKQELLQLANEGHKLIMLQRKAIRVLKKERKELRGDLEETHAKIRK